METIIFALTNKQTELLSEFFQACDAANGECLILGQFHESTEGRGFCQVAFIEAEKARRVQEVMGRPAGEMIEGVIFEVHTDVE